MRALSLLLPRIGLSSLSLVFLLPVLPAPAAVDAWTNVTIGDGVVWKQITYTSLFSYKQNVNVLDIDMGNANVLVQPILSDPAGTCEETSEMGDRTGALAAINGGFFGSCVSVSMLKINNSFLYGNPSSKPARATLGITQSTNTPYIDWIAYNNSWPAVNDALGGGPNLVSGGAIDVTRAAEGFDASYEDRAPRTAVGITSSGHLLMVTVDGRTSAGGGMTLSNLAQYMVWLGCAEAMNLDGGGSTTMYVRGEPYSGVVNYPSDNGTADHYGERSVATALGVWAPQVEIIDNVDAGFTCYQTANWGTSTQEATKYGANYRYRAVTGSWINEYCKWEPSLDYDADYEVFAWYPSHAFRPTNAAYTVYYDGGLSTTVYVNQQTNGGQWVSLGTYPFKETPTSSQWVKLWTTGDYGAVVGDAIRFVQRD